jgi:uncharacterized protein (DUF983 family)
MTEATDQPVIYGSQKLRDRSRRQAMWRAARNKCPQCGEGKLLAGYVKVEESCSSCGLSFSGHRADDAPPYFTMMIVGHIVIPLALELKRHVHPPLALQFLLWTFVMGIMTWWLLPKVKGALIGLQWANRMHGFSDTPDEDTEESLRQ